jgi:hypothetical protein
MLTHVPSSDRNRGRLAVIRLLERPGLSLSAQTYPETDFKRYCQNVAGRTLVGLRYWNEVDEEGESSWVFECRDVSQMNELVGTLNSCSVPDHSLRVPPMRLTRSECISLELYDGGTDNCSLITHHQNVLGKS